MDKELLDKALSYFRTSNGSWKLLVPSSYLKLNKGSTIKPVGVIEELTGKYYFEKRYRKLLTNAYNVHKNFCADYKYFDYRDCTYKLDSHLESYVVFIELKDFNLTDSDYGQYKNYKKLLDVSTFKEKTNNSVLEYEVPIMLKNYRYRGDGVLAVHFRNKQGYLKQGPNSLYAIATPSQWMRSYKTKAKIFGHRNLLGQVSPKGVFIGSTVSCERYDFMGEEEDTIICLRSPYKDLLSLQTGISKSLKHFGHTTIKQKAFNYSKMKSIEALLQQ